MLIFVRIETHAVIFSGISVRIVDLASEAFWSHFVRIGTRHFGQNLAKSVRIGTSHRSPRLRICRYVEKTE